MQSIGVRELRQHASRWLARVRAGESFQVTDRGHPVAVLSPAPESRWAELVATGRVSPPEGNFLAVEPLSRKVARSVVTSLQEDRDGQRF